MREAERTKKWLKRRNRLKNAIYQYKAEEQRGGYILARPFRMITGDTLENQARRNGINPKARAFK